MKKFAVILFTLIVAVSAQASVTIATFSNPSSGSFDSLFNINWTTNTVTGGWADGKSGLNLEFNYTGTTFSDVWFEMSPVAIITQPLPGVCGYTNGGVINFYQAGTTTDPLLTIQFNSGIVSTFVFGSADATFTGSQITMPLDEEQFSFAFANIISAKGEFSATAAFDSSAVPEPATLILIGLGSLSLIGRK